MNYVIEYINPKKKKVERKYKGKSLLKMPNSFVMFDIETTGLVSSYNEIIEIGAIKVKDDVVVDKFNMLIKPKDKIDGFISALTGITNEMVKNELSIEEVLPQFINFIGNSILIGHNVNFDINFIYDSMLNNNLGVLKNDYVDTLKIARKILPELKHHRLSDLANYYNIDYSKSHRAMGDSEITLEIYYKLKEEIINNYDSIQNFELFMSK